MSKKKRTINELRQVKDAAYKHPLSHDIARIEKSKKNAVSALRDAHTILVEGYPDTATTKYILSSISHLVDLLNASDE